MAGVAARGWTAGKGASSESQLHCQLRICSPNIYLRPLWFAMPRNGCSFLHHDACCLFLGEDLSYAVDLPFLWHVDAWLVSAGPSQLIQLRGALEMS